MNKGRKVLKPAMGALQKEKNCHVLKDKKR